MSFGLRTEPVDHISSIQMQIRDLKTLLRRERKLVLRKEDKSEAVSGTRNFHGWRAWDLKFVRLISAKKILRNIDRTAELPYGDKPFFSVKSLPDERDYLKHDLLYFIGVTEGDEDTLGHSQFVAAYSLLLARAAGIEDPRHLADIERGALLHDIGKIAIPDFILKKSGWLTPLEKEIVKEHPIVGHEIIREFDFLKKAVPIVLHHHEQFDGSGYPHGLAGDDIPLDARIFSIADTIDAITSDRPYRKGRSFEEAFHEIERCSGSQFDLLLVGVMCSICKERWLQAKLATLARLALPTVH